MKRFVAGVAAGLLSFVGTGASQGNAAEPEVESPPPAAAAADALGYVTVVRTGSRIRKRLATSMAPLTIITREEAQTQGQMTLGEILQALPEQRNAMGPAVNNGGDGSVNVNLRGLGAFRTLVLLNGRRVSVNDGGASGVDLTTLPTAAVDRIEILKDGASAVYGSDAIGGVVNIITRDHLDRPEASVYVGGSSRRDGAAYHASVATGAEGDMGHMLVSFEYDRQERIMAGDRPYTSTYEWYDATGATFGAVGVNRRGSGNTPAPRIVGQLTTDTGNPLWVQLVTMYQNDPLMSGEHFVPAFVRDPSAPLGWRPFNANGLPVDGGDLYNFPTANYLLTPSTRMALFASGEAPVGPAHLFFEGSFARRSSSQQLAEFPLITWFEGVTVSADNPYNPFGRDFDRMTVRLMGLPRVYREDLDASRLVGGLRLKGSEGLLASFQLEASVTWSNSHQVQRADGNFQLSRLADALGPGFEDPSHPGTYECGTVAAPIVGCVPLNIFGPPGSVTSDQLAALNPYTMSSFFGADILSEQVTVDGELFHLASSRPVALALGYEHRLSHGDYVPDGLLAVGDVTGAGIGYAAPGSTTTPSFHGHWSSDEAFAELALPIVSDVPFAEDVEASAAARIFHFEGFDTSWTWKLGARWQVVRALTLRGTLSTAYRAPDVYSRFWPRGYNIEPDGLKDPCQTTTPTPAQLAACGPALNAAPTLSYPLESYGGNPDLQPETALVATAGVVFEPDFLEGLLLTVDGYRIAMHGTIGGMGDPGFALNACYPSTPGVSSRQCDHITRDPVTHEVTLIDLRPQNLGAETVMGIDVGARYDLRSPAGRFGLYFDGTWLAQDDYDDGQRIIHGAGNNDLRVYNGINWTGGDPRYRFVASLAWNLDPVGATVGVRYVGSLKECSGPDGLFNGDWYDCSATGSVSRRVASWTSVDLTLSARTAFSFGKTRLLLGVRNVLDAKPPVTYNSQQSPTDMLNYDVVGRYFWTSLSHTF